MAGSSESNDASDIFWPGYVDAIANLAINLLFVIAIMAIVVISATLQVQELMKRKDRALADDVSFTIVDTDGRKKGSGSGKPNSNTNAESEARLNFAGGNRDKASEDPNSGQGELKSSAGKSTQRTTTIPVEREGIPQPGTIDAGQPQKQEEVIQRQSREISRLQQDLKASQSQLEKLQASLAKSNGASGMSPQVKEGPDGVDTEAGRHEMVQATKSAQAPTGNNKSSAVQGGVIVNFNPDSMQLTEGETVELVSKLKTFAPLNGSTKWRILVVAPKGFSEAVRLAFYRANAVRNVLLKEGVPGDSIDVRVQESEHPSAASARVVVRPAQ